MIGALGAMRKEKKVGNTASVYPVLLLCPNGGQSREQSTLWRKLK